VTTRLRVLPIALIAALGCESQPERVAVHPVSGQVTYAGKPAAGVKVFFYPTSGPTIPVIPSNPHGVTGPDGKFTLSTYGDGDGAPEGTYQVILFWPPEAGEDEEEADTDRLLGWYAVSQSKLTADVKPGANDLPPFQLPATSRPAGVSEGIPGRN
jgi:hypothetical protein